MTINPSLIAPQPRADATRVAPPEACYRVWATYAKRLELYVIDDEEPLPDPRSMRQPFGVDGMSLVVDHSRFEWSDAGSQQRASYRNCTSGRSRNPAPSRG